MKFWKRNRTKPRKPKVELPRWRRWLIRISATIVLLILIPLLTFFATAASIYFYGYKTSDQPADAAIVLGAAVWKDRPSPVFRERIAHAVRIWESGQVDKVIFTGGQGERHERAESHVARDFAISKGLDPSAAIVETQSRNTRENLQYAEQVGRAYEVESYLIVSDPIHMKRAMLMSIDVGLNADPSPTTTTRYQTWETKQEFLIQETWYYIRYVIARMFFSEEAYETIIEQTTETYTISPQL